MKNKNEKVEGDELEVENKKMETHICHLRTCYCSQNGFGP
jgi:hypothetical protein